MSPCRTCLPSSIVHDAADALPPEAFVSACILPGVLLLFWRHAWGQRICSDETTAFRWSGHNRAATRKQGIQNRAWAGRALPQPPLPPRPAGTNRNRFQYHSKMAFLFLSQPTVVKMEIHAELDVPEAARYCFHSIASYHQRLDDFVQS